MSTLSEMQSRIADDLNRTDLSTQIAKAINRAITHYSSIRTWFNETSGTLSTVSGQESYATSDGFPSDILEIDKLSITESSTSIYPLKRITFQELRDINQSGTTYTGCPSMYSVYENKLYLYPVPDDAYTITVYYKKSYAELASGSNDWTDNAEDLIESRAQWWIYSRLLHNDKDAAIFKQNELDALQRIYQITTDYISVGRIRKTDF